MKLRPMVDYVYIYTSICTCIWNKSFGLSANFANLNSIVLPLSSLVGVLIYY